MNLVLFESGETAAPLPRRDERAQHILRVLQRTEGDDFDVGLVNGPRGKAIVRHIAPDHLELTFTWAPAHPPPPGTALAIGLPRPQTARDILRDATTLGATALHFVSTRRSDPNYARSSLWSDGSWHRHVLAGAAQAFDTHVPDVSWDRSLASQLDSFAAAGLRMIALDVHEAPAPLATLTLASPDEPLAILLGPERGWDESDRALFARHNVERRHLGPRVLRSETAVTVALALINAARMRG